MYVDRCIVTEIVFVPLLAIILERIIKRHKRQEYSISENQFESMPGSYAKKSHFPS